jgi:flagellar biosynthesis protein FlhB
MQEENKLLAKRKQNDARQQIATLIAVVILFFVPGISVWAFYLLAISQCISCCYWYIFFKRNNIQQYKSARNIRKIFFIVLAIHVLCIVILPLLFFLLIAMVFVGPILGTSYLLITMKEIAFYKGLENPYGEW